VSLDKIYSDDPLLKYKEIDVSAMRTKSQIDGVLAEYGVQDVHWHFNKEAVEKHEPAEIYVRFILEEVIEGVSVKLPVKVDCPVIWDKEKPKGRPPRPEEVNWNISFRALHWYIYTHLNSAYAMRSSKIVAFLPYIQNVEGKNLKDLIVPRLSKDYQVALTDQSQDF
jgi:hypothetical protein